MTKNKDRTPLNIQQKNSESTIAMVFDMIQNWLRPNHNQPKYVQAILFIIKLPVLLVLLALSPILLLFMLLTLVVAL